MKISTLEKILLCCTGAFLLVAAGYYVGTRSTALPYRVEAEHLQRTVVSAAPAPTATAAATEAKINLNTATVAQLAGLPGLGEKRAADIVADRAANGPFRIVEDITRVKGIGEGTLNGLMDYITAE